MVDDNKIISLRIRCCSQALHNLVTDSMVEEGGELLVNKHRLPKVQTTSVVNTYRHNKHLNLNITKTLEYIL